MNKIKQWYKTICFLSLLLTGEPGIAASADPIHKIPMNRPEFTYVVDKKDLLRFLHSDENEYIKAMKSGETLVKFSLTKGIKEEELIAYFISQKTKQLDMALLNGQIDQHFYNEIKRTMPADISKAINFNPNKSWD